jgi:hypothetical protein
MSRWVVGAAVLVLLVPAVVLGGTTSYNFDGSLDKVSGPGTMTYAIGTSGTLSYGAVSSFSGIQSLAGDPTVMYVPSGFKVKTQGLLFNNASAVNGDVGATRVNNYTVIMDVLIPQINPRLDSTATGGSQSWFCLFNTDPTNSNDGDMFIRGKNYGYPNPMWPYGNMGVSGQYTSNNQAAEVGSPYAGSSPNPASMYNNYVNMDIRENTWYRIAMTVTSTGGSGTSAGRTTWDKYITDQYGNVQHFIDYGYGPGAALPAVPFDGIATYYNDGNAGTDTRWSFPAAGSNSWIFGDNDGDSEAFYAKSFSFTDGVMSQAQILALGGPQNAVPEPSTFVLLGMGIGLLLWARRR